MPSDASPESATVVPIILASDKTHLATSGKVKAWPVYMTIGNIANDVRFVPVNIALSLLPCCQLSTGSSSRTDSSDEVGIEKHQNNLHLEVESQNYS